MTSRAVLIFLVVLLSVAGCAKPHVKQFSGKKGYTQTGKASYYAMKYNGRKTASGDRFNNWGYTAAHKKLPFGTKVRVTNLANHKTVDVVINDRGPFVKGRVIDLTRTAFAQIGNLDSGVIKVKIQVLN